MGFKLTEKALKKMILQEVRKIAGGPLRDEPEEDSEDEHDEHWFEHPSSKPGYQEADPSYEKEVPQKELDGLLSWAKTQGFNPDDWE